jgi:hypothetical protein
MKKNRLQRLKGQIAPFLVAVMAVLLLAIVATRLIGESGFQRIRMANIGDGTLISSASSLCRDLNQIRQISLGKGGMMMNYVALQGFLLGKWSKCPCKHLPGSAMTMYGWPDKSTPYLASISYFIKAQQLFELAQKIAEQAPKRLRTSLYEGSFGGALVDEPKPFLASEVEFNVEKRITKLNYEAYLKRDSNFTVVFRSHKRSNGGWYNASALSYSWNKSKKKLLSQPGQISPEPLEQAYEAYLRVEGLNVPGSVTVIPQLMPLLYFWLQPKGDNTLVPCPPTPCTPAGTMGTPPVPACYCCVCATLPGIMPLPWAWISAINLDSNSFGLDMRKKMPFKALPFFAQDINQQVTIKHRNRIHIQGNVWSGFEPKMEE